MYGSKWEGSSAFVAAFALPLSRSENEVQRAEGSWLVDGLLVLDELKARLRLRELPN
jgi:hypothetical protein